MTKNPLLQHLIKLMGEENVLTDELSLALYAYDCSLSRTRPDGVILVKQADKLAPLITLLNQFRVPFIPRASATNHAGSCAALAGGFILNLTHLNRILEINTREGFARIEPGVITGHLQQALEKEGFFYAPDPASTDVCTLGGNLAQNASGARCLKYGNTLAHVLEAEVVLPTGEKIHVTKQSSFPQLLGLLAGSEGTLGIVTQLKVKILPIAKNIQTFLVTFPSLEDSIQAVTDLVAQGIIPRCVEAMDHTTLRTVEDFSHAGYPTEAQALLILELDGPLKTTQQQAVQLEQICLQNNAQKFQRARSMQERQNLWRGRRGAYAATARLAPNVVVGDGTVPRSELPRALKEVHQLLLQNNVQAALLFHAGDGNFHPHLVFDERNKPETSRIKKLLHQILQICVNCGGTISGEHGIGVEKRALMAYQYNAPTLFVMEKLKQALDPLNLCNPLKIIPLNYPEKARLLATPVELKPFVEKLAQQTPFQIVGAQTRIRKKCENAFSARLLNRLVEIDTQNYTVTAQSGIMIADLMEALEKRNLYCALPATNGTLGGLFCSGLAPEMYAHITGLEGLLPDGSFIKYGGKFVKNAAGYNLIYLFGGSQGKLGIITQLTLRIYATPVDKITLLQKPQGPDFNLLTQLKPLIDPTGVLV